MQSIIKFSIAGICLILVFVTNKLDLFDIGFCDK